jgi:hypothetical protein
MTHICCPPCRLRFARTSAYLVACPECGEPTQPVESLSSVLGFRLLGPEALQHELPLAAAVSLPVPDPSMWS